MVSSFLIEFLEDELAIRPFEERRKIALQVSDLLYKEFGAKNKVLSYSFKTKEYPRITIVLYEKNYEEVAKRLIELFQLEKDLEKFDKIFNLEIEEPFYLQKKEKGEGGQEA